MTTAEPRSDVRASVWATRIVFGGNGALFATWVSRIPAVRDDLGATERGLGFALLFIAVGSLIAMPLSGRLVARFGARRVIGVCVATGMLAYPLLGLAPSLVHLAAVLLLVGAAVGVWDVAMNVSAHEVEERAGRTLMPGFHACWSIGSVVGAGFGALAARAGLGPPVHFTLGAALIGVASVVALRSLPDAREEPTHPGDAEGEHHVPSSRGSLLRDPRLVGLGVMTFCAAWAEGSANDWLALMLNDERGASGAGAALGFAIFSAAMTTARFAGNAIVARAGRVATLRGGAVVGAVGVLLVVAVPSLFAGYAGALLWGLGIAIAFPLAMTAAGETPGRGPAAIAMVATIAYSGFLVGPPLIGTIAHDTGLDLALTLVLGLTAGMLLLAHTARRPAGVAERADVRG